MTSSSDTSSQPSTDRWVRVPTTPEDVPGTGRWERRTTTTNEVVVPTDRWVRVATTAKDQPGTGRWVKRLAEEDSSTYATTQVALPEPLGALARDTYWQHAQTVLWVACGLLLLETEVIAWLDSAWFSILLKQAQGQLDALAFRDFLPRVDQLIHVVASGGATWWITRLPVLRQERRKRRIGTAAGIVIAIASVDEFLQVFSHSRTGGFSDWIFSLTGVAIASLALYFVAIVAANKKQLAKTSGKRRNTTRPS